MSPEDDVITVRDIMQTEVVSVGPEESVVEVMRSFAAHQISGAPVVGAGGEVLGVVSATDLIRVVASAGELRAGDTSLGQPQVPAEEYDEEDPAAFFLNPGPFFSLPGSSLEILPGEPFEGLAVRDIMTAAAFSISPGDPVEDAAAFLLRGRIHRALVVEEGALIGLISTFDLLRALAGDRIEAQ